MVAWLSAPNYFPGFTEGWVKYIENPVMTNDTYIYHNTTTDKNVLLEKYGMLIYQVID